jgi:beta-glucosidase
MEAELMTQTPEALLAAMTREEKIAQLFSVSITALITDGAFDREKASVVLAHGAGQIARTASWSALPPAEARALGETIQRYIRDETRLGIPAILHEESNCGFQSFGATVFPQAIGVACSWNPAAARAMHAAIRQEILALGGHLTLSPVLDLVRDPRWGRCEETFGEDPLLAGRMAVAAVKGLQSDDLREGVGATLKHFAGHGSSEGGRNEAPVHMGQHEFRDVMLMPFEMAIKEAAPLAVMNGYHDVDGVPCAGNHDLLTGILRDEWGFEGIVVSDYEAVDQLRRMHFTAADKVEAGAQALAAGIDVELPFPDCFGPPLSDALDRGLVDEKTLDRAVLRVLRAKVRLGLLDDSRPPKPEIAILDSDEQRAHARKMAEQTIVLLKNEGVLPLAKAAAVAVIGPFADATRNMLGDYAFAASYDLPDGTRPAQGVAGALASLLGEGAVRQARGCDLGVRDEAALAEAVTLARASSVAVVVVGGRSGSVPVLRGFHEHGDMSGEGRDRADVGLVPAQRELVEAIAATGTPVVLVVVDGRPLALGDVEPHMAAIVHAWLPGHMGGEAIARILTGAVEPCGRLCVSMPRETGQVPVHYSRSPASLKWNYIFGSNIPLYAFGHGLTYSRFEYANLRIDRDRIAADGQVTLDFAIRNMGDRPAVAVPQLYFRDRVASVVRPLKQLADFDRIALAPGEARQVRFVVPATSFAFHDRTLRRVVEPGEIALMIGESSADIRLETVVTIV